MKASEKRERATELEWLRWFYRNTDFGPADDDVQLSMKSAFMEECGKNLPGGYNEDGDTCLDT